MLLIADENDPAILRRPDHFVAGRASRSPDRRILRQYAFTHRRTSKCGPSQRMSSLGHVLKSDMTLLMAGSLVMGGTVEVTAAGE